MSPGIFFDVPIPAVLREKPRCTAIARCPAPLEAHHFSVRNADPVGSLDQFIYRFTKAQDVMSSQLFRRFARDARREPEGAVPVIDLINLVEGYGYLPSAARWQENRQMRKLIAHEYVLNVQELAGASSIAFSMAPEMAAVLNNIRRATDATSSRPAT